MTQFTCDDELGGPPGCLQYHTATTGVVASFNYPIGVTSLSATSTTRGKYWILNLMINRVYQQAHLPEIELLKLKFL